MRFVQPKRKKVILCHFIFINLSDNWFKHPFSWELVAIIAVCVSGVIILIISLTAILLRRRDRANTQAIADILTVSGVIAGSSSGSGIGNATNSAAFDNFARVRDFTDERQRRTPRSHWPFVLQSESSSSNHENVSN